MGKELAQILFHCSYPCIAEQISEKKSMEYNCIAMKCQCRIKTYLFTFVCTGALSYPNIKSMVKFSGKANTTFQYDFSLLVPHFKLK